jgi:hypothetical protein
MDEQDQSPRSEPAHRSRWTRPLKVPFFDAVALDRAVTGLIVDCLVLVLTSLILDHGAALRMTFCLVAGHWGGAILILLRRRTTRADQECLRFGTLIMLVPGWLIMSWWLNAYALRL